MPPRLVQSADPGVIAPTVAQPISLIITGLLGIWWITFEYGMANQFIELLPVRLGSAVPKL